MVYILIGWLLVLFVDSASGVPRRRMNVGHD